MIGILKRIFGSQKESDDSKTIQDDKSSEAPYMAAAAVYLAVILIIGVPMWFYTCSVTRYSTPKLNDIESKLIHSPPTLHLDISIIQLARDSSSNDEQSDNESDRDSLSRYLRTQLPKSLETSNENVIYNIDWRVRRPTYQESSIFQAHLRKDATNDSPKEESLADLEGKLLDIHKNSSKFRLFMYLIRDEDLFAFCGQSRVHSYTINMERFIYLCPSSAMSKPDDYSPVVSLVLEALDEVYAHTIDRSRAKLTLDSRVDLLFTLVPETMDTESFEHLIALSDKIHHIYERNVRQKHPELKNLVNIRPITQNYLDLLDNNLLDRMLNSPLITPNANQTNNTHSEPRGISIDNSALLFRSFESRLSMHSAKNVHHVILLVPKAKSPRILLTDRSGKSSKSLNYLEGEDNRSLLIVNDDKSLTLGLRAIVRRLAGLSSQNICKSCLIRRDIFFCSWELDAIMGTSTMMKLYSTYTSLKGINQQVMGIKIPKEVAAIVRDSHGLALKSIEYLKTQRTAEAYTLANRAYELSEAAFYDPSLIESLYFPDDLKYAIYLPFFLPLAYPIILSIVRLLRYSITNKLGCREKQKVKVQ